MWCSLGCECRAVLFYVNLKYCYAKMLIKSWLMHELWNSAYTDMNCYCLFTYIVLFVYLCARIGHRPYITFIPMGSISLRLCEFWITRSLRRSTPRLNVPKQLSYSEKEAAGFSERTEFLPHWRRQILKDSSLLLLLWSFDPHWRLFHYPWCH